MRVVWFFLDIGARLGLPILLVLLVGFVVATIIGDGYLVRWSQLPDPPSKAVELMGYGGDGGIYISAADNRTYQCARLSDECWIQLAPSNGTFIPKDHLGPCVFSLPEKSLMANTPPNVRDCIQFNIPIGESMLHTTYVLDDSGTVWTWSHGEDFQEERILSIFFTGLGAVIGLAVGIFWIRRDRSEAAQHGVLRNSPNFSRNLTRGSAGRPSGKS